MIQTLVHISCSNCLSHKWTLAHQGTWSKLWYICLGIHFCPSPHSSYFKGVVRSIIVLSYWCLTMKMAYIMKMDRKSPVENTNLKMVQTRTIRHSRGAIRCLRGVRIPSWSVKPAVSPIPWPYKQNNSESVSVCQEKGMKHIRCYKWGKCPIVNFWQISDWKRLSEHNNDCFERFLALVIKTHKAENFQVRFPTR
jgi:hypothetical protein